MCTTYRICVPEPAALWEAEGNHMSTLSRGAAMATARGAQYADAPQMARYGKRRLTRSDPRS